MQAINDVELDCSTSASEGYTATKQSVERAELPVAGAIEEDGDVPMNTSIGGWRRETACLSAARP
jgi:hypothetical protein